MVWQSDCRAIMMLTQLNEGGVEKCVQYWPTEKGQSRKYGQLMVKLTETETNDGYVVNKLRLKRKSTFLGLGQSRDVHPHTRTHPHPPAHPHPCSMLVEC